MGSDRAEISQSHIVAKFASQALPNVAETPSRPTQTDLAAITNGKDTVAAEAAWDDPDELAIMALVHRAWAMEVERKGWSFRDLGNIHIKALRMCQAALRLIPKREPIA